MQTRFRKALGVVSMTGLLMLAWTGLPTAEDPPRFSGWSPALSLGPVNSTSYDACPTISKDGLALYFRSDRPGSTPYDPPNEMYRSLDIWVAQRDSAEDPWGEPVNIGPTINGPYDEFCTAFSPDGHWMIFVSYRPPSAGNCGTGAGWNQDLWISHRKNKRDDFGWEDPENLGCVVNSPQAENGPAWFEDDAYGRTWLYYSSNRPGGPGLLDIYVSEEIGDEKGNFGPPRLVTELNTAASDYQPVLRKDGREMFFASNRPGGAGSVDLWTSIRESTLDPWSTPVNLGPLVNSTASDFHPTLSFDGATLYFATERGGAPVGRSDLWMTTRSRVRGRP